MPLFLSLACLRRSFLVFSCAFTLFFLLPGLVFAHPVKVGVYENKPLVYQDEQGKFQGLTIDVLRYIAEQENWDLQFVPGSWSECLQRLENGETDLQVAIAVSSERKKRFSFPEQTLITNWGRLYRHPDIEVDSLLDLDGKTVALLDADIHAKAFTDLMEKFGQNVELVMQENYDAVLEQAQAGKVDVGVVNRMYAMQNAHRFQVETTPMIFNPIEVRYAAPKVKSKELLLTIDHYLKILRDDKNSIYYQSLEKWFGHAHPAKNQKWLMPVVLVISALLILIFIVSLLLKKQVAIKTVELKKVNQTLTAQVDQLQKTEGALRESEEQYRNLLETTSEGFLLVNTELRAIVVNHSLCEMMGYSQEELLGEVPFVFAEDENKRNLLEKFSDIEGSTHRRYEVGLVKKDGSDLHVVVNATTLRDNENNVAGAFAFITDDTERQRNRVALQAEKELLTVTLRSIGDAVITTDIEGRVTFLNRVAEMLTGWSDEEAKGKNSQEVFNIINEKTGERCASPVQRVIELGRIIGLANHTALIARNGSVRSIADSGAPIRDVESKIIGVVIVFRDTTNEQRMEEELLKGRKLEAVGVLAGGIAHDFNNILAAILGNIELAAHRISEKDDKVVSLLNDAQKATRRATKLTQQLLTFSKGGEPVKEAISLPELIKDSADFVLPGSRISCDYDFVEDLWSVDIDSGQISQVIQNIIINADHAMPEGGKIKISCANVEDPASEALLSVHQGSFVRISIQDSGIGIPREIIDKIFDPYFSTKQHGSGLGLAICHSIINKHDGYLTVNSIPGRGTTLTFYLPAVFAVNNSLGALKTVCTVKSVKIMVMDDEEILRNLVASQLAILGHESVLVTDGEQAINKYQELQDCRSPVDLVIMDLTIPGGVGGQEAAQRLLHLDPEAKIIVASGYSNDPIMANYRDYGFCAAVSKPFDLKDLSDAIASVL